MTYILFRWEARKPNHVRQIANLPISAEHDLTWYVITSDMTSTWNFRVGMCRVDEHEGTASFSAIRHVLRELIAESMGVRSIYIRITPRTCATPTRWRSWGPPSSPSKADWLRPRAGGRRETTTTATTLPFLQVRGLNYIPLFWEQNLKTESFLFPTASGLTNMDTMPSAIILSA